MKRIREMSPTKRADYDTKKKSYTQVSLFFLFQSLSFTGPLIIHFIHSLYYFLSFFHSFSFRPQNFFSVPEHRAEKNRAARAAHATPAGAATKLAYKLSAHGNVDVVLPNSCAGNHVRKFSVHAPGSDARAAEMDAVCAVVRQVLSAAFRSGAVVKCGVTGTITRASHAQQSSDSASMSPTSSYARVQHAATFCRRSQSQTSRKCGCLFHRVVSAVVCIRYARYVIHCVARLVCWSVREPHRDQQIQACRHDENVAWRLRLTI